jgi:hypothetical protein
MCLTTVLFPILSPRLWISVTYMLDCYYFMDH